MSSHEHHIEWREVVTSYPCPTCDAAPGERCVTAVRHDVKWEPHAARSRLASEHRWRYAEQGDDDA